MRRLIEKSTSRWRRFSRGTKIFLILLVLALVAFRLALPHLVQDYVNNKLDELPEYDGQIGDVDIHILRGAYSIDDIDIVKTTGETPVPFVSAKKVDFSMEWKELFHGALAGEIYAEQASLNFVKAPTPEESQTSIDDSWIEVVKDLFPFRINKFEIRHSSVTFKDFHAEPRVDVYATNLYMIATNLTNTRDIAADLPARLRMSAVTLGRGQVNLDILLDPLAEPPEFDLRAGVEGMDLTALNDLFEAYAKLNIKRGTLEVYSEIMAENGQYEGYVKPFLEDLDIFELEQDAKNPLKLAWQAIAAGIAKIFKNHPRDQVATKIPISGSFESKTDIGLWRTVANLLRHAFIQALSPTFDRDGSMSKAKQDQDDPEEGKETKKEKKDRS